MSTLGQRLRKARNLRGIKQVELAKSSGVSQQLISRIENDKVDSTTEIFKLSDVLNVNPRWLATDDGEMENEKRTASDASEEEMRLIHLIRNLTAAQRNGVIKNVENITQQNAQIIKELTRGNR